MNVILGAHLEVAVAVCFEWNNMRNLYNLIDFFTVQQTYAFLIL